MNVGFLNGVELLGDAALKNTFELKDRDVVLFPFGAGFNVEEGGFQDLDKMTGFTTALMGIDEAL